MKPFLVLIALSLLGLNAHAGLNKWVDAEGKVHYSDSPPPDVKAQTVRPLSGKGQAEAPASYSPKSYTEREAELKKSGLEKEEATKKKEQQDAAAEARKRNCAAARQHARSLEEGTRVFNYDANGERVYLDDDARAQRLEEARKTISADCD
jgi:hypothetical protein